MMWCLIKSLVPLYTRSVRRDFVPAGMNQVSEKQMNEAEKQFKNFESMINSMTPQERSNPDLLAKVSKLAIILTWVICAISF